MTPHTGMTKKIMENIDPHDTMVLIDTVIVINVTALDQLIGFQRYESQSPSRYRNSSRNHYNLSRSPSRFRFVDVRPRCNNEYPRTNPSYAA